LSVVVIVSVVAAAAAAVVVVVVVVVDCLICRLFVVSENRHTGFFAEIYSSLFPMFHSVQSVIWSRGKVQIERVLLLFLFFYSLCL
jgi:hypothetical protein